MARRYRGQEEPPPAADDRQLEHRERDPAASQDHERGGGAVGSERGPAHAPRQGTGLATAALVVGALALLALVVTFGFLFFIALPLGIAAVVMGALARRRVSSGVADRRGGWRATGGLLLGLVAAILSALVLLLVVLGFAALDGLGGVLDDLQQETQQLEGGDDDGGGGGGEGAGGGGGGGGGASGGD